MPALFQTACLCQSRAGATYRTAAVRPGTLGQLSANLLRPIRQHGQERQSQYRVDLSGFKLRPKRAYGVFERFVRQREGWLDELGNALRLTLDERMQAVGRRGLIRSDRLADR